MVCPFHTLTVIPAEYSLGTNRDQNFLISSRKKPLAELTLTATQVSAQQFLQDLAGALPGDEEREEREAGQEEPPADEAKTSGVAHGARYGR